MHTPLAPWIRNGLVLTRDTTCSGIAIHAPYAPHVRHPFAIDTQLKRNTCEIVAPEMFHQTISAILLPICSFFRTPYERKASPASGTGALYITPTCTSSMQELIKQGMKQKFKKSCFRCKNTWHVESNYLLQPPKYLIIVVNRFRYINDNFTKDRCSIPMDMTVVLGLHKFSLQATIDHHGPSMYSGHYTASINCCKGTFYCNDSKITEFEMIDTKISSTAYVVMYKLIT